MRKGTIIDHILKEVGAEGEKYFDKLNDFSVAHLDKLLKVCKLLKK